MGNTGHDELLSMNKKLERHITVLIL